MLLEVLEVYLGGSHSHRLTLRITGLPPSDSISSSSPLPRLPSSHCLSTAAASASAAALPPASSSTAPALLPLRAFLFQLLAVMHERNLHTPCTADHGRVSVEALMGRVTCPMCAHSQAGHLHGQLLSSCTEQHSAVKTIVATAQFSIVAHLCEVQRTHGFIAWHLIATRVC